MILSMFEPEKPYPALAAALKQAPGACGVYLFKDSAGRVLYVGKAVNLRNRLGSYLKDPEKHGPRIDMMLKKMAGVDFVLTATEREALILERNLIKEHRPRFNVMLRDDKNYLCLRLDLKEDFPALRFVRRFFTDGALYFGPFASAGQARETMKVMKRAFRLRTCKDRRLPQRSRPCLEHQVGLCLGPCAGKVPPEAYRRAVEEVVLFLKGRGRSLVQQLKHQMSQAAAELDFERAAALRDRIGAISGTLEHQAMARPTFKDQDFLGVARDEGRALVLVLMVRGWLVTGTQEYFFPEPPAGGDLLGAFAKQYYGPARPLPDEILLPEDLPDRRVLAGVLSEQKGASVLLQLARRGDRARLLALAAENARAALARRREKPVSGDPLGDLKERLNLASPPIRLECLDISTLQGKQAVGAVSVFADGAPDKALYRRYRIREVAGQDDYAMLREVVRRRYGKEDAALPDLLVVDGGKGQLAVVTGTLKELGRDSFPVVALAKEGEREGTKVRDRLFLPGRKNPKFLPPNSPGYLLLLHLRDEAHRTAVAYHRKRARKELVESALEQVPGIGPARLRRLLTMYGSLEELKKAGIEELAATGKLPLKTAQDLKEFLSRMRDE
jgi:excinuclease ABC subunit C